LRVKPTKTVNGYVQLGREEEVSHVVQPSQIILFKFFRTFIYIVYTSLSYLMMLAVMSFNMGVFLSVILGSGIGYGIFTVRKEKFNKNNHDDFPSHH